MLCAVRFESTKQTSILDASNKFYVHPKINYTEREEETNDERAREREEPIVQSVLFMRANYLAIYSAIKYQ